jgi:hypothetical protein
VRQDKVAVARHIKVLLTMDLIGLRVGDDLPW